MQSESRQRYSHSRIFNDDKYEKLIYEVSVSAKEGRNAFKCIHCKAKLTSKQWLNYHCSMGVLVFLASMANLWSSNYTPL
jgi:hypothetical protein